MMWNHHRQPQRARITQYVPPCLTITTQFYSNRRPNARSLYPEIVGIITDHLDISSLMRWRQTCTINYSHSTASLRRSLTVIMNPFLSRPTILLQIITQFKGVIGGEVALAYIRRDLKFQPRTIEICASTSLHEPLCIAILSHPELLPDIACADVITPRYPYSLRRDIVESLRIRLRNDQTIYIHRSSTESPLSPIARASCTALMNYVSPDSFGCAYPRLTLDNKALQSQTTSKNAGDLSILDQHIQKILTTLNFDIATDPATWPRYRMWSQTPATVTDYKPCWRSHYICPEQARYFGDRGSIVEFIDPLLQSPTSLRANSAPPFRMTVIWRLSSAFRCALHCEQHDRILPRGLVSTVIFLIPDPISRAQSARAPARQ